MINSKKGFTLIELLIVIGILAILATTVVLVLNPAQILAETRDTQRISDLASVSSAIGLYLATVGTGDMSVVGACATNWWASASALVAGQQPFNTPTTPAASQTIVTADLRKVTGVGWVPMNFGLVSGGSPLSVLPSDPSPITSPATVLLSGAGATLGRWYAYQCTDFPTPSYEIDANMESAKFASGGTADVESKDGGTTARSGATVDQTTADLIYEVGNAAGLAL